MNRTTTSRGFTLSEMLVAISIFAALSLAATALLSSVMTSRELVKNNDIWMRQLETTKALLKADLIQMVPRRVRDTNGQSTEVVFQAGALVPSDPILTLTRRGWDNLALAENRGTLQLVSYRVEEGALIRSTFARDTPTPLTEIIDRRLIKGLASVDVRALQSNQWVRQLIVAPLGQQRLPQAIEVVLEFENEGLITWLFQTPGARQ